ncbi:site-specific integrase [Gelidibacter sp.]|uniref:site-specific integrase n=1 Tax=Gelidibacter sp. TaxID=2018083 RepID=UPI002CC247B0|nr:site-specific integrase [Gelidibacter sp.]HUH27114.1 site-specific integrase [Gelidibacter sp.]
MAISKSFSILFWINASRAINNEAEIFARITVNGKRVNLSLKRKANLDQWDSKTKRLKGNTTFSRQTNQYLEEVHSQIFQIYQDLKFKGKLITAQLVKAHYTGGGEDQGKSLFDIINYHKVKTTNTLAKGSIRLFGVTESHVARFLKKHRKTTDVYLKEINYEFLTDFQGYLSNLYPAGHPKSLCNNTVMKHIQRLRKIVTLAYHLEWVDKDPFVRWQMSFEKTNREFLSEIELHNLETKQFVSDRLDRVRDLFVFSCYTGISYVDIMKLTTDHVAMNIDGSHWIMSTRQKTNTVIKVPLLPKAMVIIKKYKDHPVTVVSKSLLPVLSNTKLNAYLKEAANVVEIKKNLTFHMARHTFATTIALSNGVPIETVSKILGHTKISTTQIYARVLEHKISSDMNNLKNILEIKNSKEKQTGTANSVN